MNRNRLLERLAETSDAVERLREELQQIEKGRDDFAVFLFNSRKEFRRSVEMSGKSGRRIKETQKTTYEGALKYGFNGGWDGWLKLLDTPSRERPETTGHQLDKT